MKNKDSKLAKLNNKIKDGLFLSTLSDGLLKKTKYKESRLNFLYNVMVAQKNRMHYYKLMKKKYYKKCTAKRDWEESTKVQNSDTVWICWLQGIDDAPELVKTCVESIKKQLPQKNIVILNKDNIFEYIDMPKYIKNKWEAGIIGPAHFSDLIRLEILIKHGGYWIDATVLCTDNKDFYEFDKLPLFMFSFYYFGFNPEIMELNNWFIKSETNNNILCLIREFMYEYWKDYNRAVDYFVFHIFMTLAVQYYEEEYLKMPIVSQVNSHVLATYIFDEFDEVKYNLLAKRCGIHKLSTRFDTDKMKDKNTFYDVLIKKRKF